VGAVSRPCPKPHKLRFAARAAAEIRARVYTDMFGKQQYAYLCRCGFFHLTTRPPRKSA